MSWTTIPDSDLDQDSPLNQPLMTALRDNPIAIAQGLSGATRILGEAAATNDEVEVLTVSAADTYSVGEGGNTTVGTLSNSTSSMVDAYSFEIVAVTGTVRARASHRETALSSAGSTMRLNKNGVAVATWSTTSTSAVERTADVAVIPGDILTFEHREDGSGTSIVSGGDLTASNGYATKSLLIRSSNL